MKQSNLKIYDISRTISSKSLVYPGDDPLEVSNICTIDINCPCNITKLGWTTHFLTHVDPPLHFIKDGLSLDDIPLSRFIGDTLVIDVAEKFIGADDVPDSLDLDGLNILFKTNNSDNFDSSKFNEDHAYVSKEAAEKLAEKKVNLVGIDYISIDRFGDESYPAHKTLLGNNVLVLEGINLSGIKPGNYTLIALPLKIQKGDGSPVRAVLIDNFS